MSEEARFLIVGRTALLVIALSVVSNMWRPVAYPWHLVEIVVVVGCVIIREHILYERWLRIIERKEDQKGGTK